MPPRLLLDVHLSHALADELQRRGYDVIGAQRHDDLRRLSDEELLEECCRHRRAIVSYNIRHFDPLARRWAQAERPHWSIILIHSRSIPQQDFGGQLRALERLLNAIHDEAGLQDQTIFLAPAPA